MSHRPHKTDEAIIRVPWNLFVFSLERIRFACGSGANAISRQYRMSIFRVLLPAKRQKVVHPFIAFKVN